MFYYVPKVKNKYIRFVNMVENDIKNNKATGVGKLLESYSGLIRLLSYANTAVLNVSCDDRKNDILVTVKLHNNTPHIFSVANFASGEPSASAYVDRELLFGELYHNLGNRRYFNNTGNALLGVKNLYAKVYEISDPSERLSYLRRLSYGALNEFAETQFPNLKNTSSIGFCQSAFMESFFEINNGKFAADTEKMANSIEILFDFDKKFSDHAEPGQYAKYKSNAVYNFQGEIDSCLKELNGVKLLRSDSKGAQELIMGLDSDTSTLEDKVTVTEMYAYDTIMSGRLMDELLNTPMDTNN